MNIRPAKKDEVKALQNLNDEVFVDNHKYDPDLKMDWAQSESGKNYFTKLLENPDSICLIAEEKGGPVGYIAAGPKKFGHRLSRYIEIENMGVSPTSRSKGIGSLLIKKCVEVAKERGYEKVFVTSYFANKRAVNFYKENGFQEIDLGLEKNI